MNYLVLLGRILFSLIFIMAGPGHFLKGSIDYAASHGVPLAMIAVPISGVLCLLGGLSVAFGYKAKWGAWMLVLFLVPVTFIMHQFWAAPEETAQLQQAMFMKNIAMVGGALLITYFGSGPLSLDRRS